MFDCLRALATLDEADIDIISLTEPGAGEHRDLPLVLLGERREEGAVEAYEVR